MFQTELDVSSEVLSSAKPIFHLANLFARTDKKVGTVPTCSRRIFSPDNFNQSLCRILVFASRRTNKVAKWKIGFRFQIQYHLVQYYHKNVNYIIDIYINEYTSPFVHTKVSARHMSRIDAVKGLEPSDQYVISTN